MIGAMTSNSAGNCLARAMRETIPSVSPGRLRVGRTGARAPEGTLGRGEKSLEGLALVPLAQWPSNRCGSAVQAIYFADAEERLIVDVGDAIFPKRRDDVPGHAEHRCRRVP